MTKYVNIPLGFLILLVFGLVVKVPSVEAERHIVTASGNSWHYRGQKSGEGPREALTIKAVAGDRIDFRQSDGLQGVFFYLSRPQDSELGRRVTVDRNFEVWRGQPLKRLSNRLFPKVALTTPVFRGKAHLVTIRIRGDFKRPIYFGSTALSTQNGRFMYGVIRPAAHRPAPLQRQPDAALDLTQAKRVLTFSQSPDEHWQLGRLSKSGKAKEVLRPQGLFRISDDTGQEKDVTDQWFSPVSHLDPRNVPWYYATTVDIDGDQDLDVIAAIGTGQNETWQWWKIISNASEEGLSDSQLTFELSELVSEEQFPRSQASHALSAAIDLDSDDLSDIILYNGKQGESLIVYMNQGMVLQRSRVEIELPPSIADRELLLLAPIDINFDGWDDLLVLASGNPAVILTNDATGSFPHGLVMILPDGMPPSDQINLTDVNGDGIPDLVFRATDQSTSIYYNDGSGRLIPKR